MDELRVPAALAAPPAVARIVERLERAGHQAWCVGGAVRDALLGHTHLDWDIATSATPDQVRRIFRRTVPVGVRFGTMGVFGSDDVLHEVTTFRRDVRTDGRHAEVEFGVSLDDDLARRDFTINAMAFSPTTGELRDPFNGRGDLAARVVRAVGAPAERMREDRLRALRGLRFAARFGFEIEPATWRAIVDSAPHLTRLSAERVKQEIEKTLDQVARPSVAFARWREAGAFASLVPPLASAPPGRFAATDCLAQPGARTKPARRILRLASMFVGAESGTARETLRSLRFANTDIDAVGRILDGWTAIGDAVTRAATTAPPGDAEIRRWVAAVGRTQWTLVIRLGAAIIGASYGAGGEARTAGAGDAATGAPARVRSIYRRGIRIAFRDPVALGDLAIDGDDIRMAGIAEGPALGRTLARLLEAVVENPALNTRDALLARARELR